MSTVRLMVLAAVALIATPAFGQYQSRAEFEYFESRDTFTDEPIYGVYASGPLGVVTCSNRPAPLKVVLNPGRRVGGESPSTTSMEIRFDEQPVVSIQVRRSRNELVIETAADAAVIVRGLATGGRMRARLQAADGAPVFLDWATNGARAGIVQMLTRCGGQEQLLSAIG